jgi:hypothetical protein
MTSQMPPRENEAEERNLSNAHPSRSLKTRSRGYGIGGGYERPYRRQPKPADEPLESYGPLPHSGYYGAGVGSEPFKRGQAGYNKELSLYSSQYGEKTSGQDNAKRM